MDESPQFSRCEAQPADEPGLASWPEVADGRQAFSMVEMVREYGVTPRALRFYETKKLIAPQHRGRARFYSRADRQRLALLLRAKALGFTLAEIGPMLATPAGEGEALNINRRQCFEQIKLLEQRKREIEAALAELRRTYSSFYARIVHSEL
jgi:DNA-binding transcriptional MerR regulator